jgi:hypothetical protein
MKHEAKSKRKFNPNNGRDSSDIIAISYGLNPSGIQSQCMRNFPHPYRSTLGPTLLYSVYGVSAETNYICQTSAFITNGSSAPVHNHI